MKVLDLFSGIGGFALGLHRAGMTTAAFCEIEPFCRQVLAKHWPGVPIYEDVRAITAERLAADGIVFGAICGGFPCQDISVAGRGIGLAGERSALWFEYLRIIEETRPRWVIIENVPALRSRGLDTVLGGLAAVGYDAEWHCVPASALGAPHRRDRVWIVANPQAGGWREHGHVGGQIGDAAAGQFANCGETLANASGPRLPGAEQPGWCVPLVTPADLGRAVAKCSWRRAQPGMGGTVDGLPAGVDGSRYPREAEPWEGGTPRTVGRGLPERRRRLMGLGNSVVPAVAEMIGRAVLAADFAEARHAA